MKLVQEQFLGRALEALEEQLRSAGSDRIRRQVQVRMAGALARVYRTDEAKTLVHQLRQANAAYDESRLANWIIYTEGLIAHYESLDTISARDRFLRAYAIAVATADHELKPICAAWLADAEFRQGNTASALSYVERSLFDSAPDNNEALSRACTALGDIACWSGMIEIGRHWYQRARGHAVASGDIGLQSSILFNSASFRVYEAVMMDCVGISNAAACHALLREVISVSNLDAGLGVVTLTTMVPGLVAVLKTVLKDWSAAVVAFDSIIDRIHLDGQTRLSAKFLAHRAWCNINLDYRQKALRDASEAARCVADCPDLDDLAVVHSRLSSVYRMLGDLELATEHAAMSSRCATAFGDTQRALREAVEQTIERISAYEKETRPEPGSIA